MITAVVPCHKIDDIVLSCVVANAKLLAHQNIDTIVVINNMTLTDTVKEMLRPATVIYSPKAGRSQARNFGLEQVKTPLVLFLDSDVQIKNFNFQSLKEKIDEYQLDFVQGKINYRFNKLSLVNNIKLKLANEYQMKTKYGVSRPGLDSCALLANTEHMLKLKFNEQFTRNEDAEILYRGQDHKEQRIGIYHDLIVDKKIDTTFTKMIKDLAISIFYTELLKQTYLDYETYFHTKNELSLSLRNSWSDFKRLKSSKNLFVWGMQMYQYILFVLVSKHLNKQEISSRELKNENIVLYMPQKNILYSLKYFKIVGIKSISKLN
ncbi:MAG: hypothetical protein CME62_03950 [Halobacteriovoraceae bacterium]|nr:hypothetical protein [Halobacteriovoraceae bacterium]|tara:strand:+ start:13974 stop:14936 length:963 start_codon:yes stop_codon:yes gene_type:complete